MRKKKQIAYILLILLMISTILAGCTGTTKGVDSENTDGTTTDQTVDSVNVATDSEGAKDDTAYDNEALESEAPQMDVLRDVVPVVLDGARIGCATTLSEIKDEKVFEIITTHFNAVTIGNELKPDALFGYSNGKCPGTYETELNGETLVVPKMDYSRAEQILDMLYDWNENNPDKKVMVRGHVLVWHSQTPEWFFHEDYDKNKAYVDKETMNKRLEWYIRTVFEHFLSDDSKYKDMFYGWDVVNEAVSDNGGKLRTDNENPNEKLSSDTHGSNSSWYHIYESDEFIINAFIYANKYAPSELELYYNDYNECNPVKRQGIINLLSEIKAKEGEKGVGTRITAMGMQGHYGMDDPNQSAVELSIKEYAKIVGEVQITEFDIKASSSYDGSEEMKEEEYERLRKRYNTLYYAIRSANNNSDVKVSGITFWGTVDHYSWLQNRSDVGGGNKSKLAQCPLLFDDKYEPKSAYYVFASFY